MIPTYERPARARDPLAHARTLPTSLLVAGGLFLAFLALYVRTAAPSVLSGDSAEFQFAAPLLGVPHPTTYPLYILLGKLAALVVPFGDLAWRVTLVSAVSAAMAAALFLMLARHVLGSTPAALVGALALGLAPGPWNAATIAEVYALLLALLAGFALLLAAAEAPQPSWRRLCSAAFVGGLGFTHHGLFAITALPLLAGYVLWLLVGATHQNRKGLDADSPRTLATKILRRQGSDTSHPPLRHATLVRLALLALCFGAGLLPWLFPIAQYLRYGPFADRDYGLPVHYFWGEPASLGQVFSLLTGGPLREGIFRVPSAEAIVGVLSLVAQRLWFEFGPLGAALGLLGGVVLQRRSRPAWLGSLWIFLSTLTYLLLLGPAVQDAPTFTLPMMLPWALWIAAGVEFILQKTTNGGRMANRRLSLVFGLSSAMALLLVAATLAWGYTRLPYSSKRQLWLFRRFGEATLAQLPPNAAVLAHWEQGTTLQYLVLAEGQRPDVWIDIVEPGDVAWGARAQRYAGRPVFFVGVPSDVAGLPVDLVRADGYADLFELRHT